MIFALIKKYGGSGTWNENLALSYAEKPHPRVLFTSMIGVSNNESPQNLAQKTPHHIPKKVKKNTGRHEKKAAMTLNTNHI